MLNQKLNMGMLMIDVFAEFMHVVLKTAGKRRTLQVGLIRAVKAKACRALPLFSQNGAWSATRELVSKCFA